MKILFTGYHNPHFSTITEYCEEALSFLGHTVVPFEDRAFVVPGRLRAAVPALARWDLRRLNAMLVSVALKERPDVCIVTGGHRVLPETLDALRAKGIRCALYTIDAPIDFDPVRAASTHYDAVFCGGSEAQVLLKDLRPDARWLPFACDHSSHRRTMLSLQERAELSHDLVFVGSYYANREAQLGALASFDLGIYGPGWGKVASDSPLYECIKLTDGLKPEGWMRVFSAAKIAVVAHYQDGVTPCRQASPKLYEAMACGVCVLCDDQPDARVLFEDGKHCLFYRNAEEMREKAAWLLCHEAERDRIAACGMQEVLAKHTYVQRMEQLLRVFYGS